MGERTSSQLCGARRRNERSETSSKLSNLYDVWGFQATQSLCEGFKTLAEPWQRGFQNPGNPMPRHNDATFSPRLSAKSSAWNGALKPVGVGLIVRRCSTSMQMRPLGPLRAQHRAQGSLASGRRPPRRWMRLLALSIAALQISTAMARAEPEYLIGTGASHRSRLRIDA